MRPATTRKRSFQIHMALSAMTLLPVAAAHADLLFDNISAPWANNFNASAGTGASAVFTIGISDTSIGSALVLPTGTKDIYGFEAEPLNGTYTNTGTGNASTNAPTNTTFTDVQYNLYVWGNVSTGTVNASSPAFSNLLQHVTANVHYGALAPGYIGTPGGTSYSASSDPYGAFVLNSPIVLPSTTVGISIVFQGSTDNGATYGPVQNLTSEIAYGVPPVGGSALVNGFYRNGYDFVNGYPLYTHETDGNYLTGPRSFGYANQSGGFLRLFGDTGSIATDYWLNSAGGTWANSTQWSNAAVPSPGIPVAFNLSSSSTYAVSVADYRYAANVSVLNDNVELDLNSLSSQLEVNGPLSVGVSPTAGGSTVGALTVYNSGRVTNDAGTGVVVPYLESRSVVVGGNGGTGTLTVTPYSYLYSDNDTAINAGSKLVVAGGQFYTYTLTLGGTSNAWTGKLDITNSSATIGNGSIGTVINQVKQGYNNGSWTGNGITSSAAAADSTHLTAVGVIVNNDGSGNVLYGTNTSLGTFNSDSPALNAILLRYTYYGDTNLKGYVNASDYTRTDNGFLQHLSGWYNGDFNYDGVVNGSDYTLLDNAFNTQGVNAVTGQTAFSPLARSSGGGSSGFVPRTYTGDVSYAGDVAQVSALPGEIIATSTAKIAAGPSTAVPEPASLGLLLLGGSSLLARRRRR